MPGEIGRIFVTIGAKIDGLEKSFSDVDKATVKIGKRLQDIGKQMTIAGGVVTAALGVMVKKTADFGDELWDLKQRTGIAADTLSSFKLAADKSGTSLSGVAIGLRFLGRSMTDAATGGKESAEAFRAIGVSVKDIAGNMRPMDEVMLDVADRFAGMEDGAVKTSLAIKLFGRSGTELIPMLNLGRTGLAELREEAKRLGIVVSNETASAADKFNDSMVSLKASLQGAGMAIATSIMPMVKGIAETVTRVVSGITEWATKNGALTQTLTAMVAGTGAMLTALGLFSSALGTLMVKLPLVAAALNTTTASLIRASLAWSAGIAAIAVYASKLIELKDALDESTQASLEYDKANIALSNKLYELVKVGAMSVDTYYELYDRFNQNAAAMASYIKAGHAGVQAQQALVEIGKKHAAQVDEQRAKTQGFTVDMGALAEKTGQTKDAFADLTRQLMHYSSAIESIPQRLVSPTLPSPFSTNQDVWREQLRWLGIVGTETKRTTDSMRNYFDGLYNDIANGFANAMEGLVDGTKSFKEFFVSIWDTIKKAFFRVIAEMVAGFLVNFVKNIVAGMSMVKAATSAFGAFGSAATAAGSAASSAAGATTAAFSAAGASLMATVGIVGTFISGVFSVLSGWSAEEIAAQKAALAADIAAHAYDFGSGGTAESNLAGRRGGMNPNGPRWAAGFSGLITQPTTATFGEGGPEFVSVRPVGAGTSAGGEIHMNFYAPIVQTTGLTRRDCDNASEYIFNAVESQARRRGFSLAQ